MKPKAVMPQYLLDRLAQQVGDKHGFTTADKIPQPPPKPRSVDIPAAVPAAPPEPVAPKAAERWSKAKRHAFDLLAPSAMYIASTEGPVMITTLHPDGSVKKRFGHNRGVWPVKIGTNVSHRDTITPLIDKDPFFAIAVRRRVWLPKPEDANALAVHAVELLRSAAEEAGFEKGLLHGYTDAGPNFTAEGFEHHVLLVARNMDIVAWTEDALSKFLDRVLDNAKLKGIDILDHKGRKVMHPGFVKLADRMVEQEKQKQFVGRRQMPTA